MRKILIFGLMALMVTVVLANTITAGEKEIDMNLFSFGTEDNYVNLTSNELVIGNDLYNNSANIFVYNNATYEMMIMNISGGKGPDGDYPSEVTLDLGDNGRPEYRFGGYGVGKWGNQQSFLDNNYDNRESFSYYPSSDGEKLYLKLPSDAVISSASLGLNHPAGTVSLNERLPTSCNWGYSYIDAYYYEYYYGYSYGYGRGRYYTKRYCDSSYSSVGRDTSVYYHDPDPSYYYYDARGDGCPVSRVYIQWNANDPDYILPDGATVYEYKLKWPVEIRCYYGNNFGEHTYGLHRLTSAQRSPSSNSVYNSVSNWQRSTNNYNQAMRNWPSFDSNAEDTYTIPSGSGNSYFDHFYTEYDIQDLVQEWQSGTSPNHGVQVSFDSTPHDTEPHDTYSYYSSDDDYYRDFYTGDYRPPSASSYYNPYKPMISIEYTLDSKDPWLDVGDDGMQDWSHPGYFNGSEVINSDTNPSMISGINNYLRTHFPDEVDDYGNKFTYVPLRLGASAGGRIVVSDIDVKYNYTASVFYNPHTDNMVGELNSVVPDTESGHSMIPINISADSKGNITLDDLHITGEKPNYRPTFQDIDRVETHEGIQEDHLVSLSDHFFDVDQDSTTLDYRIQMNDQEEHVDLFINSDDTRDGTVYLGIDTSKDENWHGEVHAQVSATDDFGKDKWSNVFVINVSSVNDLPYLDMELPDLSADEGIDPILQEYNAPSGRNTATGKILLSMGGHGAPYFKDIEGQTMHLDFELLGPDMKPTEIIWSNEDRHRIYRSSDSMIHMTILPPQYTEDPDNYVLLIGSDPDYTSEVEQYYLRIFISDDPDDLYNQTNKTLPIHIQAFNDPPEIQPLPDIVMDEDSEYISPVNFIDEFIRDIDNDASEIDVNFEPTEDGIHLALNEEGKLHITLDMDFNGVVPVIVHATDGEKNATEKTFNVRVRSINDPPVLVVDDLYEGKIIDQMTFLRGKADDIEKHLQWVEVAVTKRGDILYGDDWIQAGGAYVWQYLLDIREFEDGNYTIYLRAFDGRIYSEEQVFNVRIETPKPTKPSDPPFVSIDTILSGEQSGTVTVTGTVRDESGYIEFVEYRIDGGIWRKASITGSTSWRLLVDTKQLTNGIHNLSVRAYDLKSYSDNAFTMFTVFNVDSDGDGIPNDVERSLLMDPFLSLDGTMDFDNDGYSNAVEIEQNYDPFDGSSHPEEETEEEVIDQWALIFIGVAVVCSIFIIGLFLLNIRMDRKMHQWKEDLNKMRVERKQKTLLQKIVDIAPSFAAGAPMVQQAGPALPGGGEETQQASLPPAQEGAAQTEQQQSQQY